MSRVDSLRSFMMQPQVTKLHFAIPSGLEQSPLTLTAGSQSPHLRMMGMSKNLQPGFKIPQTPKYSQKVRHQLYYINFIFDMHLNDSVIYHPNYLSDKNMGREIRAIKKRKNQTRSYTISMLTGPLPQRLHLCRFSG